VSSGGGTPVSGALPYYERPDDHTPVHTTDLPPTPIRDRNIVATAWIEAPDSLLLLGADLVDPSTGSAPVATYKRRIGRWLLWRAGPATDADARYVAIDGGDLTTAVFFRLFPDGTGEGVGPDGEHYSRFRSWKQSLLVRNG
jgi:hypothetical protein